MVILQTLIAEKSFPYTPSKYKDDQENVSPRRALRLCHALAGGLPRAAKYILLPRCRRAQQYGGKRRGSVQATPGRQNQHCGKLPEPHARAAVHADHAGQRGANARRDRCARHRLGRQLRFKPAHRLHRGQSGHD